QTLGPPSRLILKKKRHEAEHEAAMAAFCAGSASPGCGSPPPNTGLPFGSAKRSATPHACAMPHQSMCGRRAFPQGKSQGIAAKIRSFRRLFPYLQIVEFASNLKYLRQNAKSASQIRCVEGVFLWQKVSPLPVFASASLTAPSAPPSAPEARRSRSTRQPARSSCGSGSPETRRPATQNPGTGVQLRTKNGLPKHSGRETERPSQG